MMPTQSLIAGLVAGWCSNSMSAGRTISGSISSGIHASAPPIMKRTAMNTIANRRSVTETTVPEVKNSFTESNSRIWLARMPTDAGRCAILIASTCSKMFDARMTSSFLPVISMIRARTMRRTKSNTTAIDMPMDSAIIDAMAPFGTTRS